MIFYRINDRDDYIIYPFVKSVLRSMAATDRSLDVISSAKDNCAGRRNHQTGSFPPIHRSRIIITHQRNPSNDVQLPKSQQTSIPSAATGTYMSLSQAAGRVLPDDGASGRARRGSSKRWRKSISKIGRMRIWSFAVARLLAYTFACGVRWMWSCRMIGEWSGPFTRG